MSIVSGYKKFKKYILTSSGFQLVSHWTNANTLQFDDGKTAQAKLGAIDGISSSKDSSSDKIAASTKLVSELNSNFQLVNQNLNGYQFRVNNGVPEYKAGADAAWVPFNKYLVLDNIRLSARYQGSGTFDVKPYISNYSKLNTENFYVGVKSFSSQDFNTAGVSVRLSYNSSTGILTISISGNTYDTPTYLIVIKQ